MSESNSEIKLTNDDNVLDIIDKINGVLIPHGLVLIDDDLKHDGFIVVRLENRIK